MKVRVLIMAMMAAFASFANAQEQKPVEEQQACQLDKRIEAHVARMNERFLLDDAKAEKFASLYKEYLLEMQKCRPEIVSGKDLSDEQIKKNMEARMDTRQKALDVEKKYYNKLSKVLNAKQLQKVFGNKDGFKGHGDRKFAPRKGNAGKSAWSKGGRPGFGPGMKPGMKPGCDKAKAKCAKDACDKKGKDACDKECAKDACGKKGKDCTKKECKK